jgi:hypothetical protein
MKNSYFIEERISGAENRILRGQIEGRLLLSDGEE